MSVLVFTLRRARKSYVCYKCKREIRRGEYYFFVDGYDLLGFHYTGRCHLECAPRDVVRKMLEEGLRKAAYRDLLPKGHAYIPQRYYWMQRRLALREKEATVLKALLETNTG